LIWRLSKQVTTQLRQRGRVRSGIRFGVGSLAHLLKKLLSPSSSARWSGDRWFYGSLG